MFEKAFLFLCRVYETSTIAKNADTGKTWRTCRQANIQCSKNRVFNSEAVNFMPLEYNVKDGIIYNKQISRFRNLFGYRLQILI